MTIQTVNNKIQEFIPKSVTSVAMLTYVAAIMCCNILFASHILAWQWWFFGAIEVLGFFYFANKLSKQWFHLKSIHFTQKLFWIALFLRLLWVFISYLLYQKWTGTAFSIEAGDELFYDEVAQYAANMMRNSNWKIYSNIQDYSGGTEFSDMGYPIYLTFVYWIFGNSIFIARVIKAILSAWTVILMYRLTKRNFSEQTGRMVAIMCALMPNIIYYCSFQLKEVEMVFLAVLFIERADHLLRKGKLAFMPTATLMLIPAVMFMFRTALAATLVMAFFCTTLLSSERVVSWGRRTLMLIMAILFAGMTLMTSTSIGQDIQQMWRTRGSGQRTNMEWRAVRTDMAGGLNNRFAKYAGAAVFAPMIFTIPFPTMNEVPGQENQKMIHGGNFVKNILSFFTIAALATLLISGDWRKYVLPLAVLCGYLVVLVFSSFAQSERFHLPILPLTLMFAGYGISKMKEVWWIKKYFPYWCALMFVAAIAWNWFKLAGRGMI
ncbi:MAG: glycosyltransferase family 39 protein [Paludibacteraceae bacterium]|nr:glycosyltransferase family 39 protein [Paludibacteraceae bacterium]